MASVMAIVSKAVFEKSARGLAIGDVWATTTYASQHKTLAALDGGGDLFLVTVRPPETLCLVAVLRAPKHGADGWTAKPNSAAIRDIHALRGELTFAIGQPLPTEAGKLGMSLQTPRVLGDDAVALLAGAPVTAKKSTAKPASAPKQSAAKPSTKVAKPSTKAAKPSAKIAKPSAKVAKPSTKAAKPSAKAAQRSAAISPVAKSTKQPAGRAARDALASGRPADALPGLLALWRAEPSTTLATLIETVSAATQAELPGLEGKSSDALDAWNSFAKRPDLHAIPALLAAVTNAHSGDAARRLAAVEAWMPDPRVDAALVGWIEAPPFHATMTKPFYQAVFKLAHGICDPNQLARLEGADAKLSRTIAPTMGDWLRAQLKKLLAELAPKLAAIPATTPAVAELTGPVTALRADSSSVDALLDAIYADPAADGPRLVYADALSERGDVRGELITIQCRLAEQPDDRELKKREKELLDTYGRKWLGELAPVVMADFRYERGFLAACRVDDKRREQAIALAGHRMWTTVHTFEGPTAIALHPSMRALRAYTYLGWREEDNDSSADFDPSQPAPWHDLLVGTKRRFESLTYRLGHDREADALAALAECKALPELRKLVLEEDPQQVTTLYDAPVLHRIDTLGLRFMASNNRWLRALEPLIEAAPTHTLELELQNSGNFPTLIALRRSDKKTKRSYTRATVEVGPTRQITWSPALVEELISVLRVIPGLREATIHQRRGLNAQAHARLAGAVKALGLDTWSIT